MEASNQTVSCSMSALPEASPDRKIIPTHYTSRFSLVPNRVFVCGIDYQTNENELLHIFSQHGAVKHVKIVLDRFGMSKGYGFVTFQNQDDALKVLGDSKGVTLNNKRLCVSQAFHKQKRRRRARRHDHIGPLPTQYAVYPAGYPLNYYLWPDPSQLPHLVPVSHVAYPVTFPHAYQSMYQHFPLYQCQWDQCQWNAIQPPAEYPQPLLIPENTQKESPAWQSRRQ